MFALLLSILFSYGTRLEMKAGVLSVTHEQMQEGMSPEERANFRIASAFIAPLGAFGVTVDSPLQDLAGAMLPGFLGGLGGWMGGSVGGSIGGGLGSGAASLLGSSMELKTGTVQVLGAVFVAMLIAAVLTRDSRAPVLVALVFTVLDCGYLMLFNWGGEQAVKQAQSEMAASSNPSDQVFAPLAGLNGFQLELTPFLWHVLIYTFLLAILARLAIQHLAGAGRLAVGDFGFGVTPTLATALSGLLGGSAAALGGAALGALGGPRAALASGGARDRLVSFAAVCPFCGNTRIRHQGPRNCPKCRRRIEGLVEAVHGHPCYSCSGILLKGAHFCHHCGAWQGVQPKNNPIEGQG